MKKILNPEEEKKITALIRKLEQQTTGEICVHIIQKVSKKGIMQDARLAFNKLGLAKTADKNSVLILIAAVDHEICCLGDSAIDTKLGAEYWQSLVSKLQSAFKKEDYFIGLTEVLEEVGAVLRKYFPFSGDVKKDQVAQEFDYES